MRNIKIVAKKVLPPRLLSELRNYRNFEPSQRPIYLRARLLSGMRLIPKLPSKSVRSLLFVCYGNIMRSPMCEALMKRALAATPDLHISVTSAGLGATPGRPAHPWAIAAAREFGISLESHRARLLTSEMVDQADLIFAMDYQNQVQLLSAHGRATKKIMLLGLYGEPTPSLVEIRDPYGLTEADTRNCYQILATCIRNLARTLRG